MLPQHLAIRMIDPLDLVQQVDGSVILSSIFKKYKE